MKSERPDNQNLKKARIINLDTKPEESVECLFNPNQYTLTKNNQWQPERTMGKDLALPKFLSGSAMTLVMTLFFDSFEKGKDVREYTDKLLKLTYVNPRLTNQKNKKGRPPRVMFRWGEMWGFKAVISQMTQRFTLFLENGMPVRATVDITFQQVEQQGVPRPQNPTSYSESGWRLRMVRVGERLDWIAYEEYGDPTLWRFIADANELSNPLVLTPGRQLIIPPLQ